MSWAVVALGWISCAKPRLADRCRNDPTALPSDSSFSSMLPRSAFSRAYVFGPQQHHDCRSGGNSNHNSQPAQNKRDQLLRFAGMLLKDQLHHRPGEQEDGHGE